MQSKKQLILWVLNVLNNESDENTPITQTKIADIISDMYPCDRKTVSTAIHHNATGAKADKVREIYRAKYMN